jgi:hypothetical protein
MEKKEKKEQQPEDRKSFRKPRLRIYGHISAITRAHVPTGLGNDGGPPGMRKSAG